MIDTPTNRSMGASASDIANWTPPSEFANLCVSFARELHARAAGAADPSKQAVFTAHHQHHPHPHAHAQPKPMTPPKAPLKHGGFYLFSTQQGNTSVKLLPPLQE